MAIIAKTDATYPNTREALRVNHFTRHLTESWTNDSIPNINTIVWWREWITQVESALNENRNYTHAVSGADIIPNADVGGYDHPIVALITPECISNCDMFTMMLKASDRATLIGSHTNGAGAGFASACALDTSIKSKYFIISLVTPSHLFGFPGQVGKHIYDEPNAFLKYNSENRPVKADIWYTSTLDDFQNHDKGWYELAIKTIDEKVKSEAAEVEKQKVLTEQKNEPFDKTIIPGKWGNTCSRQTSGVYMTQVLEFGLFHFTRSSEVFADEACINEKLLGVNEVGSYKLHDSLDSDGSVQLDLVWSTAEVFVGTEALANNLNEGKFCEDFQLVAHKPLDIIGQTCTGFRIDRQYTRLKIEGDQLYLGEITVALDGTTPAKRAKSMEKEGLPKLKGADI